MIGLTHRDPTRRALARMLGVLLALVQLAASTVGAVAVVCDAGDGHVEIEIRGAACCEERLPARDAPPPRDDDGLEVAAPGDRDDCGPCRDAPLLSDAGVPDRGERISAPAPDALPASLVQTVVIPRPTRPEGRTARPPERPPGLDAHRTVVLRC